MTTFKTILNIAFVTLCLPIIIPLAVLAASFDIANKVADELI